MIGFTVVLLTPFLVAAPDEKPASKPGSVVLDIAYADADEKQKLDLYLPDRKDFPTIVFTYGGGWHTGSRKSVKPIGEKLQGLGYGCALVSHRLTPPDKFPAHIEDVASAFAWVKKNIEAENGDPKRVYLMGHSSGAHLSLLLATDAKYLSRHKLSPADIAGVIGLSPPVDLEPRKDGKGFGDALLGGKGADAFARDIAVMKDASPIHHITKGMPRTLLIVGDQDFPMLEGDAKAFAAKAKDLGLTVGALVAKDCDHMGVARGLLDDKSPVLEKVLAFLKEPAEPTRKDKTLSEWIALLKSPDVGIRNNAASVLISFGPEGAPATKALALTLTDENADVRRHSALALGAIGPKAVDAADALRKSAKKDVNPSIRVWAARALFDVSPDHVEETVNALAAILDHERGGLDRVNAAAGLGKIGPRARKALPQLKLAADDKDPEVAAAARKAVANIEQEETKLPIVAFGDSITRGVRTGVKPEETFAALLQADLRKQKLQAEVVNLGIGGERTDQALKRLEKAVIAFKPKLVLIMYGTNDSYVDPDQKDSRVSAAEYKANLKQMVTELRKNEIEPILMTPPRWGDKAGKNGVGEHPNLRLEQYVKACRELAAETKTPLVDHFAHWSKAATEGADLGSWTTDECHPNPRGHREIAELLQPVVMEMLRKTQK